MSKIFAFDFFGKFELFQFDLIKFHEKLFNLYEKFLYFPKNLWKFKKNLKLARTIEIFLKICHNSYEFESFWKLFYESSIYVVQITISILTLN